MAMKNKGKLANRQSINSLDLSRRPTTKKGMPSTTVLKREKSREASTTLTSPRVFCHNTLNHPIYK